MYEYGDNSGVNAQNANTMVPNVMFDNTMSELGKMQVQEGGIYHFNSQVRCKINKFIGNLDMGGNVYIEPRADGGPQQTMPIYAIDASVQQFEIPDPILRRTFARKVFITLVLQHVLTLPVIEIFILFFDPISHPAIQGVRGTMFCLLIALYFFSDMRRYPPVNVIAFATVTLLLAVEAGVLATWLNSQLAIFPHLIVIVQILSIVAYSEQTRYKFTVINAILLVLLISVAGHYFIEIVFSSFSMNAIAYALLSLTTYRAPYIVYDMHLMLSGHHGYNLQPHEYIFAATNIYADMPNLLWRMIKFFLVTPLIKMYHFLVGCCSAEVC
nr:LOW QUALITY PROTEIN: protein lifeguard 1 [Bactrocera oleae]